MKLVFCFRRLTNFAPQDALDSPFKYKIPHVYKDCKAFPDATMRNTVAFFSREWNNAVWTPYRLKKL